MEVMNEPIVTEGAKTFEAFFHDHYERLLRAMYLATGDRHEAEDLTQDAFVRVYERWDLVRGAENPLGYVYRVALNARRSRLRRLAVAARKALHLIPQPPSDHHEATDERISLRNAMAALPDGQREAIVLIEWLDMTDVEAGAALGISAGAVRTRLHRARAALRDQLRGEIDE
jgi:RNA polymerase sigma-70 factor (ECF subfamily)